MQEVNPQLQQMVEQRILPRYQNHDPGHDRGHVDMVIKNSMELCGLYPSNPDMVYTIAAYHDVGVCFGREDHHITGGKFLREDEALGAFFTPEEIECMAQAVEDHRASGKEEPRSLYGKIIGEADRIIDPENVIYRCMEYGKAHFPQWGIGEQCQRTIEHIQRKYGEQGYLQLWLHSPRNVQGLQELRRLLENKEEMLERCRKYFGVS